MSYASLDNEGGNFPCPWIVEIHDKSPIKIFKIKINSFTIITIGIIVGILLKFIIKNQGKLLIKLTI